MKKVQRVKLQGSSFLNFLLLLGACSALVLSFFHVPRFREIRELEQEKAQIERLIADAEERARNYARLEEAVKTSPHFRMAVLGSVTGEHPYPVVPLTEWLRQKDIVQNLDQNMVQNRSQQDQEGAPAVAAPPKSAGHIQEARASGRKKRISGTRTGSPARSPR